MEQQARFRCKKRPRRRAEREKEAIPSDVLGSYTGTAADGSPPVQDADDL